MKEMSRGYLYSVEIAQMCYVFSEIRSPSDEVVQYMEDVVRHQLNEIVRVTLSASERTLTGTDRSSTRVRMR